MVESCGYYAELAYGNAFDALEMFKHNIRTDLQYYTMQGGLYQIIERLEKDIKSNPNREIKTNACCNAIYFNDNVLEVCSEVNCQKHKRRRE